MEPLTPITQFASMALKMPIVVQPENPVFRAAIGGTSHLSWI
jgi:hypothetical protein